MFRIEIGTTSRTIAFLRAINVGGGRTVNMGPVRQAFEALGFSQVATYGASGNVAFETNSQNARSLERKLEKGLCEALGFEVAAFIRTPAERAKVAAYPAFSPAQIAAAAELNIIFLKDALVEVRRRKLQALRTDTNAFCHRGREIYWLRRKAPGGSTFSNVPLERALGQPFTIRGAQTVKKMAAKFALAKTS